MAFTGQKALYTSSVQYAAVTAWAAATAKTVGNRVRQNAAPALNNERVFICIVAGTTHATTEPTWNLSRGDKTTDNTATWMEATGLAGLNGDVASTPDWLAVKNTNITQGHLIKNNAASHYLICTTAGTAGNGAEPTWNLTAGNTTVDNGATWTSLGVVGGFGKFTGPHARLDRPFSSNAGTNGGPADPDRFYVGSDHAETQSTAGINWSGRGSLDAPIDVVCIDIAGTLPPVSADLRATATVSTTGSNTLAINGAIRWMYGITFSVGTSGNVSLAFDGDSGVDKTFESCKFALGPGTGTGSQFNFGNAMGRTIFKDSSFKFTNTSQILKNGGLTRFINCFVDPAGSVPSTFVNGQSNGCLMEFIGCDLSFLSGSIIASNNSSARSNVYGFYDCKFPASFTPYAYGGSNTATCEKVTFSRCSAGSTPIQFIYSERSGTLQATSVVYRHLGASENGVPFGWQVDTTAHINLGSTFFEAPSISAFNSVTGANKTVTVYGVVNGAALPTDKEIYLEVQYLGTAGNTQATIKRSRVADFLDTTAATNHAADTSDWDDGLTARANTTAYTLGQVIKLASNPGRIFFCTTAGTTAGSEPGGYASAVDGGSVTDNTAVFRAGVRFKMAIVMTSPQPQQAGLVYANIIIGKLSTTYYFDPMITIT